MHWWIWVIAALFAAVLIEGVCILSDKWRKK